MSTDNDTSKEVPEKKRGYLDNKRLHETLKQWIESGDAANGVPAPDYVGECIMKIAHGFSKKHNWVRYTPSWKEELISFAVEQMVRSAPKYDYVNYKNPHAFFSWATEMAFKNTIKRLKKNHADRLAATVDFLEEMSTSQESEYHVPHEVHMDLLEKLDNYGVDLSQQNKGRGKRSTKLERASESAVSMEDWLDE